MYTYLVYIYTDMYHASCSLQAWEFVSSFPLTSNGRLSWLLYYTQLD